MLPPQGAVPQQQIQGGVPAAPHPPRGAVPQGPQQGAGSLGQKELDSLRNSPDVKQAITVFLGKEVPLETVPDEIIKEVAGMVHKLGVQGAVAMAQKMLPPEIQQQLRQGTAQGQPGK